MDDRTGTGRSQAYLAALGLQLRGGRFAVERTCDGELTVVGPDTADGAVAVTCGPREDDGGRLWFFGDGEPLAEADQGVTAIVAIRGVLAAGGRR